MNRRKLAKSRRNKESSRVKDPEAQPDVESRDDVQDEARQSEPPEIQEFTAKQEEVVEVSGLESTAPQAAVLVSATALEYSQDKPGMFCLEEVQYIESRDSISPPLKNETKLEVSKSSNTLQSEKVYENLSDCQPWEASLSACGSDQQMVSKQVEDFNLCSVVELKHRKPSDSALFRQDGRLHGNLSVSESPIYTSITPQITSDKGLRKNNDGVEQERFLLQKQELHTSKYDKPFIIPEVRNAQHTHEVEVDVCDQNKLAKVQHQNSNSDKDLLHHHKENKKFESDSNHSLPLIKSSAVTQNFQTTKEETSLGQMDKGVGVVEDTLQQTGESFHNKEALSEAETCLSGLKAPTKLELQDSSLITHDHTESDFSVSATKRKMGSSRKNKGRRDVGESKEDTLKNTLINVHPTQMQENFQSPHISGTVPSDDVENVENILGNPMEQHEMTDSAGKSTDNINTKQKEYQTEENISEYTHSVQHNSQISYLEKLNSAPSQVQDFKEGLADSITFATDKIFNQEKKQVFEIGEEKHVLLDSQAQVCGSANEQSNKAFDCIAKGESHKNSVQQQDKDIKEKKETTSDETLRIPLDKKIMSQEELGLDVQDDVILPVSQDSSMLSVFTTGHSLKVQVYTPKIYPGNDPETQIPESINILEGIEKSKIDGDIDLSAKSWEEISGSHSDSHIGKSGSPQPNVIDHYREDLRQDQEHTALETQVAEPQQIDYTVKDQVVQSGVIVDDTIYNPSNPQIQVKSQNSDEKTDAGFNRRKLGSNRRNKGRQQGKNPLESPTVLMQEELCKDNEPRIVMAVSNNDTLFPNPPLDLLFEEQGVSKDTGGEENVDTSTVSLKVKTAEQEELSKNIEKYSTMSVHSYENQSSVVTKRPDTHLKSFNMKCEHLQEDINKINSNLYAQDFGQSADIVMSKCEALYSKDTRDTLLEDTTAKDTEEEFNSFTMQDSLQIEYSTKTASANTTKTFETMSKNLTQGESPQITVKSTDDFTDNQDEHLKEIISKTLDLKNEDIVQDYTNPKVDQIFSQEKEGMQCEIEENKPTLSNLQPRIFSWDPHPQQISESLDEQSNTDFSNSASGQNQRSSCEDNKTQKIQNFIYECNEKKRVYETETKQISLHAETVRQEEKGQNMKKDTNFLVPYENSIFKVFSPNDLSEVQSSTEKNHPVAELDNLIQGVLNPHNKSDLQINNEVSDKLGEETSVHKYDFLQCKEDVSQIKKDLDPDNLDKAVKQANEHFNITGKMQSSQQKDNLSETLGRNVHTDSSFEFQNFIKNNHPETDLKRLIQEYHSENQGKSELSHVTKEISLLDKSAFLQIQEKIIPDKDVIGSKYSDNTVKRAEEHNVLQTDIKGSHQIDTTYQTVACDVPKYPETVLGDIPDQDEIINTIHTELSGKRAEDSSYTKKELPAEYSCFTKEGILKPLDQANKIDHVYGLNVTSISSPIEVNTNLGQIGKIESLVEGTKETSNEPKLHNSPLSREEQTNVGFSFIGNIRKMGSSQRNKGRQCIEESKQEVLENTSSKEASQTPTQSLATIPAEQDGLREDIEHKIIMSLSQDLSSITSASFEDQKSVLIKDLDTDLQVIIRNRHVRDNMEISSETDVEMIDKSMNVLQFQLDQPDTIHSKNTRDAGLENATREVEKVEVHPTQDSLRAECYSETVVSNVSENEEVILKKLFYQAEMSELTLKSINDLATAEEAYSEKKNYPQILHVKDEDSGLCNINKHQITDSATTEMTEFKRTVSVDITPNIDQIVDLDSETLCEMKDNSSGLSNVQTGMTSFDSHSYEFVDEQPNKGIYNRGNRRKIGSSRRIKGKQQDKELKEEVQDNTMGVETLNTIQTKMAFEEPKQDLLSEHTLFAHGDSADVQSSKQEPYPETKLKSFIQEKHSKDQGESETDLIKLSHKSHEDPLVDKSDFLEGKEKILQNKEAMGPEHSDNAIKQAEEHESPPTDKEGILQMNNTSEMVVHEAVKYTKVISSDDQSSSVSTSNPPKAVVSLTMKNQNSQDPDERKTDVLTQDCKKSAELLINKSNVLSSEEPKNTIPGKATVVYEEFHSITIQESHQTYSNNNLRGDGTGNVGIISRPLTEQTKVSELNVNSIDELETYPSKEILSATLGLKNESSERVDEQTRVDLHSKGGRKKMGSSRRNKGRDKAKDSSVEVYKQPLIEDDLNGCMTEHDVKTLRTVAQEQKYTNIIVMNKVEENYSSKTEDVNIPSSGCTTEGVQPSLTVDQEDIGTSSYTHITDREVPKPHSKDHDEYRELCTEYVNVKGSIFLPEPHACPPTAEMDAEKCRNCEHTEPESGDGSTFKKALEQETEHAQEIGTFQMTEKERDVSAGNPEVYSTNLINQTEKKKTYGDSEISQLDKNVQSEDLHEQPQRTAEKSSNLYHAQVEQGAVSSTQEMFYTDWEENSQIILSRAAETHYIVDNLGKKNKEKIKTEEIQEMHQISHPTEESVRQTLQSDKDTNLDSQPQEKDQDLKDDAHPGLKTSGHRRKMGSSRKNKGRKHTQENKGNLLEYIEDDETTQMFAARQEEFENFTLPDILLEEKTCFSHDHFDDSKIAISDFNPDSNQENTLKSTSKTQEKDAKPIDETEDSVLLTGHDTNKMCLMQSAQASVLRGDSTMQSILFYDNIISTRPEGVHVIDQEEALQRQNKEALSSEKDLPGDEVHSQETKKEVEAVGFKTTEDCSSEVECSMDIPDLKQDEEEGKCVHGALQGNTSKEFISALQEPAMDTSNKGRISTAKDKPDSQGEKLQITSQQMKRKIGSSRRTLMNSKKECERHDRDETEENGFSATAETMYLGKMEVVGEVPVNVEVLLAKDVQPQQKTSLQHEHLETETSDGLQSSNMSMVFRPEPSSTIDLIIELPKPDGFKSTDTQINSEVAERNSNLLNQPVSSNTGVVEGKLEVFFEFPQSTQAEEHSPENIEVRQVQDVHEQPPGSTIEIIHSENPGIRNRSPNLTPTNRRRKMGSTRKILGTGTKQEILEPEHESDTLVTSGDVTMANSSVEKESKVQLHTEHPDHNSHQGKEKQTVEISQFGESLLRALVEETAKESPVQQSLSLETEQQGRPGRLSLSPTDDDTSESASGGRKKKFGSNRKAGLQQRKRDQYEQNKDGAEGIKDEGAPKATGKEESSGLSKISKVDKTEEKGSTSTNISEAARDKTPEKLFDDNIRLDKETWSQPSFGLTSGTDKTDHYNVVMIGESCVGKTSFMKRAQSGKFSLDLPASVGLDSCKWTVVVDGKPVVLQLWDTAGQERFHSITRQVFHKAQAFLLMYDITSSQSFAAVSYWANSIQESAAEDVMVLLLGNKCEHAHRQVKTEQGDILAKEYNFKFMECSAATGENVIEALEAVARMLSQRVDLLREEVSVLHKEPAQRRRSKCC